MEQRRHRDGTVPLVGASLIEPVVFQNRLLLCGDLALDPDDRVVDERRHRGGHPTTGERHPERFDRRGKHLYFTADDGEHGLELWKSDGTTAGTVLVKDVSPGTNGSSPYHLTAVGNRLFFAADDGTHGLELWVSDGTAAGTRIVEDVNSGGGSSLNGYGLPSGTELLDGGGVLYFNAYDGVHGTELWQQRRHRRGHPDGEGHPPEQQPYYGANPSNIHWLTRFNGAVWFAADDGVHGTELWKTDGTAAGTVMVKDISGSPLRRPVRRPF